MKILKVISLALVIVLFLGIALVYGGIFNVAADDSHWRITSRLIESVRERSIAVGARAVGAPPALEDPQLIAIGARHYAEMCTGCHLAPGIAETEIRAGLYPKPQNLARQGRQRSPEETFWIIKHGLKMSGMPAWGVTHDDRSIWGLTAFVMRLPRMTAEQYRAATQREATPAASPEHHHEHTHDEREH